MIRRQKRKYVTRRKLRDNALLGAQATPPVSEGLEYKVTTDTGLELFTRQPYAAVLTSQLLADKLRTDTHVMLGSRVVSEETPKRRRLGI